jgi:hypothetical protein
MNRCRDSCHYAAQVSMNVCKGACDYSAQVVVVVRFFISIFVPYFTILHNTISIILYMGFIIAFLVNLRFEIDAE